MSDLVAFLRAAGCFGACIFAMYADSWWVHGEAAGELSAVIFIPLAVSTFWLLLRASVLTALIWAVFERPKFERPKPDYEAIEAMEREIWP